MDFLRKAPLHDDSTLNVVVWGQCASESGIPYFMHATEMRDLCVAQPLRYLLVYHYKLLKLTSNVSANLLCPECRNRCLRQNICYTRNTGTTFSEQIARDRELAFHLFSESIIVGLYEIICPFSLFRTFYIFSVSSFIDTCARVYAKARAT